MEFNLRSATYGDIRFTTTVPESYGKWVIAGSRRYIAKGKFGSILLQQITAGGTNLFYSICDIRENLALDFVLDQPVWGMHIALESTNSFQINKTAIHLKPGQFNMVNASSSRGTFFMEKGKKYRALTISYPLDQLRTMVPIFPFLRSFITPAAKNKVKMLFKQHHWINSTVIDMTDHLLSCLHRGNLRRYYFNLMVKELLFSLLSLEYAETIAGKKLDSHRAEAMNEARYILETSYGKPVTMRKIARQVEMDVKELENELNLWLGT
jgi:hypothetical protein